MSGGLAFRLAAVARPVAAWLRNAFVAALACVSLLALADGTCKDFLKALALRESQGDPRVINPFGYVGLFQMGEAALIDAGYYRGDGTGRNDWRGQWTGRGGVSSLEDFRSNPAAQVAAITTYHQRVWGYIRGMGLDRYAGQTIGGVVMTQSGMVAAAHLVGSGNLRKFLESGGAIVPRDGNRVPLTQYASRFGGYQLTGAGADCASYAQGVPMAGVPIAPPASGVAVSTPAFAPVLSSDTSNPDDAYYQRTGHTTDQLATAIKLTAAGLLMLLAAGSSLGAWGLFASGTSSWHAFVDQHRRTLMLVFLLIVIIT